MIFDLGIAPFIHTRKCKKEQGKGKEKASKRIKILAQKKPNAKKKK